MIKLLKEKQFRSSKQKPKLYDSDMNRINTNKPLEGLIEQDNKHEKNNVKEQSIKR